MTRTRIFNSHTICSAALLRPQLLLAWWLLVVLETRGRAWIVEEGKANASCLSGTCCEQVVLRLLFGIHSFLVIVAVSLLYSPPSKLIFNDEVSH